MKKSILVTGGAGYIGSHTTLALLDKGEEVVVLDDLSDGLREMVPKGAIFVEGDVHNEALIREILLKHNVEAILHFAAFVRVEESVREPEKYKFNNVEGTRALLRAAENTGAEYVIYSGSASVYGNPAKNPIAEDAPPAPMSPYAETKLAAEEAVLASRLKGLSLRYFNPAGVDPAGRSGYRVDVAPTHLVRTAVRVALGLIPAFHLNGNDYPTKDGTCVRDFIHISDLAQAHLFALEYLRNSATDLKVFNCGSGAGYSVAEVLHVVKKVSGKDFPIIVESRRPGDPASSVADISRIKKEMGWQSKKTLEDMVRDELAWVGGKMQTT